MHNTTICFAEMHSTGEITLGSTEESLVNTSINFYRVFSFSFCPCVTLFDTWVEMTGQTLLKDFLLCTFLCCAYLTWLTGFLCFNGSFKVKKVSGSLYPVDSLVCLSLPRPWGKLRHKTTFFKTIIFSLPFVLDMF